jgi:lipopolysaccharide/colanic/teichoic acid biosynthesis glycosyltransferase
LLPVAQNDKVIATQDVMAPHDVAGIKKVYYYSYEERDATRFFDVAICLVGLVVLFPAFILIALLIKISSKGPVIFSQQRVGKNGKDFTLYKFRTMQINAAAKRSITIGHRDNRIIRAGYFLRRFKLDELPQMYNVLKNDMSIVGPRPELRKYVHLYNTSQREILFMKPGITDYASILFKNENELLASQADPEQYYIDKVIPLKIRLSKKYKNDRSVKNYFTIIFKTVVTIFV